MERKVNAPDKETLDSMECAQFLGIGEGVWDGIVKRGEAPKGIPFGKKTVRWHWMDVVAVLHMMSRGVIKLQDEEEIDSKR